MHQTLAKQLVATAGDHYSQAVSMDGANQVVVDYQVVAISGGDFAVSIEQGNDLANWENVITAPEVTLPGDYRLQSSSGIACAYVRVKFTANGGTAVVAAGIDTGDL